jgi:dsRNA-specific ribonuclease
MKKASQKLSSRTYSRSKSRVKPREESITEFKDVTESGRKRHETKTNIKTRKSKDESERKSSRRVSERSSCRVNRKNDEKDEYKNKDLEENSSDSIDDKISDIDPEANPGASSDASSDASANASSDTNPDQGAASEASEESKEEEIEVNPNNLKPTEEWLSDLKKYLLEKIIPRTTTNKSLYANIVSEPAMNIWKSAFTSETFDANKGQNYEELEKLGDKVIGLDFILYLMDKYPDFSRRELSEISSYYLSKKELSKFSHKLDLSSMARSNIKGINLEEDLFESLFGALFIIGDKFIVEGAGNILCKRLLYSIFSEIEIDLNVAKGKPKTQVIEIFHKAGWGDVIIEWNEDTHELTLRFTSKAIKALESIGIKLDSDILAKVVKNTKTSAEEEAFRIALRRLNQLGISKSNVKDVLQIKKEEFSHPELKKYMPKILPILRREGISSIHFSKPQIKGGSPECTIIQLIGIKKDTKEMITLANGVAGSVILAKKKALENFLEQYKK